MKDVLNLFVAYVRARHLVLDEDEKFEIINPEDAERVALEYHCRHAELNRLLDFIDDLKEGSN